MENEASGTPPVRSRLTCARQRWPTVRLVLELDVPVSKKRLWEFVSDLRTFLVTDPYHRRIISMRKPLSPGDHLAIEHGLLGVSFFRFGRLLGWSEGSGYSFSDLSARGPRCGFPHIFEVAVEASRGAPRECSRLRIEVKGRWTAMLVPAVLRQWWLNFTCRRHLRLLHRKLEELFT
jgi:hypothetical protein